MIGTLSPHRNRNPRWCDECIHPTTGQYRKARWIWRRGAGLPDIYLCTQHAERLRET